MRYLHVLGKKLGSICIIVFLSFISLSGCIGPKEISQRLIERLGEKEKYEWNRKLDVEQSFKFLEMINLDWAKVETYSFVTKGARYLHIAVETTFSNAFNLDWDALNLGSINVTVTDPSGESMSKEYSPFIKDPKYKNFFYIADPKTGTWTITIELTGVGTFRIFVEAYEPA